ncbi:GNAT family N-acetyltransferase [Bacteroidota bacterium]
MEIIDLIPEYENLYCLCLEDWSDEMQESGDSKKKWYDNMKDKGLRVKLAKDEEGKIVGMIQYVPIEYSFAEGRDLYFIICIWVHGHKQGVGDNRKKGIGKKLIRAAEEDVISLGYKGLAAWGLSIPVWMKASWFKKRGYKKVDKDGMMALLWKPFTDDAKPPKIIKQKKKPLKVEGQVTVQSFHNGWCPAQNIVYERAKRAVTEFDERVVFKEYNTSDRAVFDEWGIFDALFIDGKSIRTGPPTKYEKIMKIIKKQLKKLK